MIATTADTTTQQETQTFRQVMAFIQPQPEETLWLDIPWQTDLWEGRRLARTEAKPIFLWAMNGNPLGCT